MDTNRKSSGDCNKIYPDLAFAQEYIYQPCGLLVDDVQKESESQEYAATTFCLSGRRIKFRVGKITPTKIGQFVTLWKRVDNGTIMPHGIEDPVDFFVISVRKNGRLGQFVFPMQALLSKGIVSQGGKGGKLAMRVYPIWDKPDNAQAKKTQTWQLNYFFEFDEYTSINMAQIKRLF